VWGPTRLAIPARRGDTPNDPACRVAIDPLPVGSHEDRPVAAFTNHQIDGPGRPGRQGDGDDLAAFAQDGERAMAPLEAKVLDVSAEGLGHPQPVQRQQADQRVIPGACQPGGDQHGPDLVAIETGGVGLVV
jgi:hypothetical protein